MGNDAFVLRRRAPLYERSGETNSHLEEEMSRVSPWLERMGAAYEMSCVWTVVGSARHRLLYIKMHSPTHRVGDNYPCLNSGDNRTRTGLI